MSTSFYVFSEKPEANTIRLRQALQTVPLEAEAWLAGRLELRLGPPELRNYPPMPTPLTGIKQNASFDLSGLILTIVSAISVGIILMLTFALATPSRAQEAQIPPTTYIDSFAVLSPSGPQGAVQAGSATASPISSPVASQSATASPSPIPTGTTAMPSALATDVPKVPTVTATAEPTNTITYVYVYPTAIPPSPTAMPTDTAMPTPTSTLTPWWPDLNGPATPIRGIITPAPAGVAGNDYSPSITGRSSSIEAVPTP